MLFAGLLSGYMRAAAGIFAYMASASLASDPSAQSRPGGNEGPSAEIVERLMRPWTGDFEAMAKRRLIRVLVAHGRSSYFLDRGRQSGITYEAFREFDHYVNKLQNNRAFRIEVAFIPVRRDQLIPHLLAGRGDIAAANLTITDARLAEVDFADPVLTGVSEIVVTGPTSSEISNLEQLSGREVFVRRSSSYHYSLQALSDTFKRAGLPGIRIMPVSEDLEDENILEMVNTGILPMTVVDDHVARLWSQGLDRIRIHEKLAVRRGGKIAWALRKHSPGLLKVLGEFVRDHKKGSAFGNILFNRYYGKLAQLRDPAAAEDLARFRRTVALFQTYARRYEFDWLLIAAQAYQESRLDQSLRSPAGAVGVMQVLPKTAAAPPIGIRNIDDLENNIHAGVAYLAHIRRQYFADPEVDAFNRQLFALAAYNAGPARIAGLRRQAKTMGLDPNKWIRNVEIVAGREIGRETVEYVAHILMYYVAYDRVVASGKREISGEMP